MARRTDFEFDYDPKDVVTLYLRCFQHRDEHQNETALRIEGYIEEHCTGDWIVTGIGGTRFYFFGNAEDAMLFKLKFSL